MEAHMKLRPLDFSSDGIFLCGMAHYPKYIGETINQADGVAARAATILSKDTIISSGAICEVEEEKCKGCGLCAKACFFDAIELHTSREGEKARIIPTVCKGCGVCCSKCPTGAIVNNHFTDLQILSQIDAAYSVPKKETEPKILGFLCNWCGYAGADLTGVSRIQYAPNLRIIRVMCSGRIHPKFIMEAFLKGIDGVLIAGCHLEDCHYVTGINETEKMVWKTKRKLKKIGIDPKRLRLEGISAGEGARFAKIVNSFSEAIKSLGPLELTGVKWDVLEKID
jgi:heterodisulfide reductase subunit A